VLIRLDESIAMEVVDEKGRAARVARGDQGFGAAFVVFYRA
jgi:hypothetical protein